MNRFIFTVLAICLFIGTANASEQKKIEKTFPAVENLKIDSKHGKIQIKTWERDEIHFEIIIHVNGSSDEKNASIAENISVDFTEGSQHLTAQTVFGDFFSLKKFSNSLFNKGKIKIEYTVQVPSGLQLEIIQKDGDIFMDSHNGNLSINLDNGNFTAQDLNGNNKLKFWGVKAKINKLSITDIEISNSELNIETADKVSGESRESDYTIHAIDNLNIKSSRDKFDIKEIEYLYGTSSFSKFEVAQLGGEIDYDLKFGHLNVFNVNNMFSFIKLDSKHADIGLSFMDNAQIEYEINHKSVKFDTSELFVLSNKETADKNTFVAKGRIGDKEAFSKLTIRANNCKIRLQ